MTAAADAQAVEATDSVVVVVAPATTDKVVDLQPGAASAIRLLVIKASTYGPDLTYKVSDGTTDSGSITLDAPQIFSGGNASLFGRDPHQLKFSNASTVNEATVQVLVARDATP